MEPLSQPSVPLAVHKPFLNPDASRVTLDRMARKYWRGGFVLHNADTELFKCDHSNWNWHREFRDSSGQSLFRMRMSNIKAPMSFYLSTPEVEKAVEVKGRWSFNKAKFDIRFNNIDGEGVVLEMRTERWDNGDFAISWEGKDVARISRKMNNPENKKVSQMYIIDLAPYVDASLVGAAIVCLDEYLMLDWAPGVWGHDHMGWRLKGGKAAVPVGAATGAASGAAAGAGSGSGA